MRLLTRPETEDFPGFYTTHFGRIAGQLQAYLGDRWEAQDLTQEAFCRAFERWDRISVYDRPEAWVRQVAWNLATNRLRHLRVATRHLAGQREERVEGPTPDRVVLTAALAKLPPKHRLAVVLHHLGQLSTAEIAQQQNVAEGTVRSWLTRGRTQLAEQLTEIPDNAPAIPAPGIEKTFSRVRRRRAIRRATLAAVIAIAVAVPLAIILRGKGSEPPFIGPTTPPSIPAATPSPSAPTARQTIGQLALLAEASPVPPQPRSDQLILVTQLQYDVPGEHKQERWLDPNGAILLRYRGYEMGDLIDDQDEKDRKKWIDMFRADMKKVGPGLFYPTWTVLSTYSTDPEVLLRDLSQGRSYGAGDLAQMLGEMAEEMDALAPPRLKAALLRTLGLVDGVTAERITAPDGSQVWAIGGQQGATVRREVLVSPATGLIVGHRTLQLFAYVYPSGRPCFECTPRPVPTASPIPPTPSNVIMWRTSLATR
ncbi:MAG TPA: sigma-70 family RNA polymerase sigma factor [Candidatus Limnocylindrales bacterium]|nr:sigma-70 family RNA polymerase sigma factor [Candidatus Limnocylindrales bacterium]